jgi:hypothetical protein
MDVKALIAQQKAAVDQVTPEDVPVTIGGRSLVVRIWPLATRAWRDLKAVCPPREGSTGDAGRGYNADAVAAAYPRVYLVDGDDVTDPGEDWPDLFDTLSDGDMANITAMMWAVHEFIPRGRVANAGKASAGSRKKKPS